MTRRMWPLSAILWILLHLLSVAIYLRDRDRLSLTLVVVSIAISRLALRFSEEIVNRAKGVNHRQHGNFLRWRADRLEAFMRLGGAFSESAVRICIPTQAQQKGLNGAPGNSLYQVNFGDQSWRP